MKLLPNTLLVVLLTVMSIDSGLVAQQAVPGQWLLRLHNQAHSGKLLGRLDSLLAEGIAQNSREKAKSEWSKATYAKLKPVSPEMGIMLLKVENCQQDLLPWLRRQPEIAIAQADHYVRLRNNMLPNDPLFDEQWQYINNGANGGLPNADLDAELAWNISTGGLSMAGDTIVVAVIDGGVQKSHPDLSANLWKNWAEIPNDGIDNDNNGYVDDFRGWNVFSQNDNIGGMLTTHGTPVSGIIGASGNNGIGVTGVNWQVKIMFVAGGNLESEILAAYDYVLQARKRYNQSNGAKGAFVVAVNCSWGIDYGMPVNAPLWCAAFDFLGEAGVLSVAATANNPVNVDIVGDLPTTCPSDYLIAVTSLDKADQLALSAAWGPVSIDLAAYGEEILTTSAGSQYGVFSGTSFAAPHVAGSVGLLYSAPCPELIALAKTSPKAAAIWSKSLILGSIKVNQSMIGLCASKGRLNLDKLMQQYETQCATCPAPFGLKAEPVSPNSSLLKWSVPTEGQSAALRWRVAGTSDWTVVQGVTDEYLLSGLAACTDYEFSLQCTCLNGETSDWSPIQPCTTLGCCEAPDFQWVVIPSSNSFNVSWNMLPDYSLYKILIHRLGSPTWQTYITGSNTFVIPDIWECTEYEIQVQGWCIDSWISLMPMSQFTSLGCGACLEKVYCSAAGLAASQEWIATLKIGNWEHPSGWGGGGYQDLTSIQATIPQIFPQSTVDVEITPGFWGAPYKEFFRVFIDFNQDGDFMDPGELAFDPGFSQSGTAVGSLTVPAFTQTGITRMRVLMKFADDNQLPPNACGTFSFGQVEDYCIELANTPTNEKLAVDSNLLLKIYPQPADGFAWIELPGSNALEYDLKVWDIAGRKRMDQTLANRQNSEVFLDISTLSSGMFFVSLTAEGKTYRGKLIKR